VGIDGIESDVVRLLARCLDDHERRPGLLVVQAFVAHDALHGRAGGRVGNSVLVGLLAHRAMHGLDDVAALPEPLKRLLPPFLEPPRPRRNALGELQAFEYLEPGNRVRPRDSPGVRCRGDVGDML
jgi:hypothetical protein